MHNPQEADDSAEEALWIAEASHHDELVVELAAIEIYVTGYVEHDMKKARRWINQAQVFLDRIGGHDLLRAWVLNNIGVVLDAHEDHEGAARSSSMRCASRSASSARTIPMSPSRSRTWPTRCARSAARKRPSISSTAASISWFARSVPAIPRW